MIKMVYYRITFQGEDGNITHSEEGMAFCEGDPNEESFKRNIASRYYRDGDHKLIFSIEEVEEPKAKKPINKQ